MSSLSKSDVDNITRLLLSNESFLTSIQNLSPQPHRSRNTTPHQNIDSEVNSLFKRPSITPRTRSRSRSNTRKSFYYLKEVILLDKYQFDQVPKPKYCAKLDELGHVYRHVEIEQNMTGNDIYRKLENMFSSMLEIETSDPIKYYGEYHLNQPVGIDKNNKRKIIDDVKKNGKAMFDWAGESRKYQDFDNLHPVKVPSSAVGSAGSIYEKCSKEKTISLVLEIGMSRTQAVKVMSILASYRTAIPVTVFVYSEFAEHWPDIVKAWALVYNIGLRGSHPYPSGHFEKMSGNWIREAIVTSEMRLQELGIIPIYYLHSFEKDSETIVGLKSRGFRLIKPSSKFPPKSEPYLAVDNYYKYRDVERVPKALRNIYEQIKKTDGGILSLDTDLPDTYMILVFLLDYLVENSGYKLVNLESCII